MVNFWTKTSLYGYKYSAIHVVTPVIISLHSLNNSIHIKIKITTVMANLNAIR